MLSDKGLERCPNCNTTEPPEYKHLAGDLKLVCLCGFSTPWYPVTWNNKNDGFELCEEWWNKQFNKEAEIALLCSRLKAADRLAEASRSYLKSRELLSDQKEVDWDLFDDWCVALEAYRKAKEGSDA